MRQVFVQNMIGKIFWWLWGLCIVGMWSVIPYLYSLQIVPPEIPGLLLFILITIQAGVLFGVVCWISFKLLNKTDLQPFVFAHPLKTIVYPGILWGMIVSLILFLLDQTAFANSHLANIHSSFWVGTMASIYGAINEEVLLRLFLLTLVYFCLKRWFATSKGLALWISTLIVSLLFGLGHLPAAFKIGIISSMEITRILLLNCIAGIIFGWLYWSKSLWTAMCAHFTADLFLHAFCNIK